jgi:hypothetical protein
MDVLILIRAAAAAAIILIGLGGYALVSRLILRRVRGKAGSVAGFQPGIPAILYFTTPDCIPCKTVQRPALRVLSERLGDRLDAIEHFVVTLRCHRLEADGGRQKLHTGRIQLRGLRWYHDIHR